jgi:hypothetical protein
MKLSLKKAELTVGKKIVPGVLLIVKKSDDEKEDIEGYCTDYIPDQLFVGLNSKPVFYSNNYNAIDEMLWDFKKIRSENEDYISRSFLEKESGLSVNFYQPSQHYDGDPVYVTVTKKPAFVEPLVNPDE